MKKLKKQKIICIIAVLLAIICLTGCAGQTNALTINTNTENIDDDVITVDSEKMGMEVICEFYDHKEYIKYMYMREKLTNTMFIMVEGRNDGNGYDEVTGLSVMPDPQTGGPMTYENWLKYLPLDSE